MKTKAIAVACAAAGLTLLSSGAASAAPGGYGPAAPTGPSGSPGGFATVVTTQTVDSSGGSVSGVVAGASVTILVPAGAFSTPVQVEVTEPDLTAITSSALSAVGFSGYDAIAGLGVKVLDSSGQPVTGTFAKPLAVTLTGSSLGSAGQKVLELLGSSSASVVASTLSTGTVTISLSQDPNLVVVSPTSAAASGTVPGATTQPTGKPYTGETVAAVLLLSAGAGLLVLSVVRRRRAVSA